MDTFRLLMAARDIPLESTVTKRNGDNRYTIRDRINVFSENGEVRFIMADNTSRLLVSETGDATAIGQDTELLWFADAADVDELLGGYLL